jgi:membrane-associated protease RseP (regulator of RpoE activity)
MYNTDYQSYNPLFDTASRLQREIVPYFTVSDITVDYPQPEHISFRGRFIDDPADCFDDLRQRFERHGFTPIIREQGEQEEQVALIALPVVFDPADSRWIINLLLFVATVLSTLYIGAIYETGNLELGLQELWRGWPFSLSIMLILGAHELGHYFAARYHKVPVTLPYFIPLPTSFSLIGTLGAFIQLKAPVKNRRALLDVGVAGPLAGLVFALPIFWYGLATSDVAPLPNHPFYYEGNSLVYILSKLAIFGRILPGGGEDVYLNQMAWAGWVGLFVTGLNLMPVGQLDGGHISYVLFGRQAKRFYWPVILGLGLLMVTTRTYTWGVWLLLLLVFGRRYAQPLDDVTPLDRRRRAIAVLAMVIFVFVFVPTPFSIMTP